MENNKMVKWAGTIDRVLKIAQGFALAFAMVAGIFIPLTLIFKEKIIADASKLNLGTLSLSLQGNYADYLDMGKMLVFIVVTLVSAVMVLMVVWYAIKVVRGILVPMKEGRPFDQGISAKIRRLGWTVLIGGGIAQIGVIVSSVFSSMAYDMSKIWNQDVVSSVGLNYSFSLWFVWTALIIFFMSYVFSYGEGLQRESDETL